MASKVYFADFRCPSWRENLQQKLARLMMTAGFGDIDMDGKYVAIKMNFGEPGNMAYLRPNWAKTVADLVKSQGGKPFLTDCNTLYIGGRKNALDHMESAYVNGFTPYSTGCHIIIADGLKGNDEVAVPVEGRSNRGGPEKAEPDDLHGTACGPSACCPPSHVAFAYRQDKFPVNEVTLSQEFC